MTADNIKLILAALVLMGGVVAFYYLDQESVLIQIGAVLGGIALATVIALQSAPGKAARVFTRDSMTEMRRVVWPTGKDTMQTTLIVSVIVALIAGFLWATDWLVLKGVTYLHTLGK